MRIVLIAFLFILAGTTAFAQPFKKRCRQNDVIIRTYSPACERDNRAIKRVQTLRVNRDVSSLQELTEGDRKHLRKMARRQKVCDVYVDLDGSSIASAIEPPVGDGYIVFYFLTDPE